METAINDIKTTCIKANLFLANIIKNPKQPHSELSLECNIISFRLQVYLGVVDSYLQLYGRKDPKKEQPDINKVIKNYPIKKIVLHRRTLVNLLNELNVLKSVLLEFNQ